VLHPAWTAHFVAIKWRIRGSELRSKFWCGLKQSSFTECIWTFKIWRRNHLAERTRVLLQPDIIIGHASACRAWNRIRFLLQILKQWWLLQSRIRARYKEWKCWLRSWSLSAKPI
jgi:hypothetical protein